MAVTGSTGCLIPGCDVHPVISTYIPNCHDDPVTATRWPRKCNHGIKEEIEVFKNKNLSQH